MKRLIPTILMLFLISVPVYADDFQEGMDAAKQGDFKVALEKFRPLAEQGHTGAQNQLSRMYLLGEGVPKNFREAEKWSSLSAEKGDGEEQSGMGLMYEFGVFVTKDLKKAAYWYRKAAKQGDVKAKLKVKEFDFWGAREGESALFSGNYKLAYEKLKPEAEQGNAVAQYRLGQMHKLGYGFSKNDQEAIKWFTKSAQSGSEDAQYELGVFYFDEKRKNYKLAARYFEEAAENKHFIAQYRLGGMYRDGKGVIQDFVQAHMWFNIAIAEEKNIDKTRKSMNDIEKNMTPSQIAEAQKLAREWVKEHKR